jgi:hypothetical protein
MSPTWPIDPTSAPAEIGAHCAAGIVRSSGPAAGRMAASTGCGQRVRARSAQGQGAAESRLKRRAHLPGEIAWRGFAGVGDEVGIILADGPDPQCAVGRPADNARAIGREGRRQDRTLVAAQHQLLGPRGPPGRPAPSARL